MRIYKTTNGEFHLQTPSNNNYDYVDVFYTKSEIEDIAKLHTSSQRLLKALVDTHIATEQEKAYKSFVDGLINSVRE